MSGKRQAIPTRDLDELHLDRINPRLASITADPKDEDIYNYMAQSGHVVELMVAIGRNGYYPAEPLIVVPRKEGGFTVVEGNRRLCALKLLQNPELVTVKKPSVKEASEQATHKPTDIPVIEYASREAALEYLGFRHITGITRWDALAKARYLRQLYDRSEEEDIGKRCLDLARTIGSRSDYVRKLLCGLSIYEAIQDNGFYGIDGLAGDISFSLITTALSYVEIQRFVGLESGEEVSPKEINQDNLKNLTLWMFKTEEGKTRLGESRNLKKLAAVVADRTALREFRAGKDLE